jgi:hypothetical protein
MFLTIFSAALILFVVYFSFARAPFAKVPGNKLEIIESDLYIPTILGIVSCVIVMLVLWRVYSWYDYLKYKESKRIVVTMILTICICIIIFVCLCKKRDKGLFSLGCVLLVYLQWLFIRGTIPFREESQGAIIGLFAAFLCMLEMRKKKPLLKLLSQFALFGFVLMYWTVTNQPHRAVYYGYKAFPLYMASLKFDAIASYKRNESEFYSLLHKGENIAPALVEDKSLGLKSFLLSFFYPDMVRIQFDSEAFSVMIASETVKFIIKENSLFAYFDIERLSLYYVQTRDKRRQKYFIDRVKRQFHEESVDAVPNVLFKLEEFDMQNKRVIFDAGYGMDLLFLQKPSIVNMIPFTEPSNSVYVPLVINLHNQENISL